MATTTQSNVAPFLHNQLAIVMANVTSGDGNFFPNSSDDIRPDGPGIEISLAPLLKQTLAISVLFTIIYGVVFVFAIVNNSLVVAVIYRNPHMRTVTNYFIANLAVADILVSLLVLPITLLSNLLSEWWFGSFLCKTIPYLQAVAVSASVNTLAAVAVERYLAICYAHLSVVTPQRALAIIGVLWFVPLCIQLPWAIYTSQGVFTDYVNRIQVTVCYPDFSSKNSERGFFLGVMFLTCYLIPLCFLALFYSLIGLRVWKRNVAGIRGSKAERNINRSKIRIVRMLVTVTVFFACSWLPLYCVRMRVLFGPPLAGQWRSVLGKIIIPMAQWLGSANSCMNPFIYCYFSEHFRQSIIAVVRSGSCCSKISGDPGGERPSTAPGRTNVEIVHSHQDE